MAALLIVPPPLDYISDRPGYVADATGLALAVVLWAPDDVSNVFPGKPPHWLLLIWAGLWYAADLWLHLIHFDAFIVALLAVTVMCVFIVLKRAKLGERITRDEILPDETEERFGDVGPAD